MDEPLLTAIQRAAPSHCIVIADPPSGLLAFLVLDDLTLGPAAGGVRTRRYPTALAALEDALRLALAMTVKCAVAGLNAGGGKCVVMEQDGMDRGRAFEELGRRIEELGGLFRTAGDLGTTAGDLLTMARRTQYVYTDERGLTEAAGRGLLRCIEACAAQRGGRGVAGLRVAIQGAGAIGSAAARALSAAGARVICSDIDLARARLVAEETGGEVCPPDEVLSADVDIVAPCALGGVITPEVAGRIKAFAVCGAANNILASPEAARVLADRGVLHVPDSIASAGAVIEGAGRVIMGLADRTPLIDALGATASAVIEEARATGMTPTDVAEALAFRRIRQARASSRPPPT
jgi:leucine dehydrogenase